MSTHANPESTAVDTAAHETLITGLRNAHALEKQVITVLEGHLKLLEDYPDLHARLSKHILETREQARRLEAGLEACGESTSMVKDALLSVMGLGQSSVQGFSDDAVLKAMTADMMTEHLEIATYRTLIALADMAGKSELRPKLEESLREEEEMAQWFDENLEAITRRFVELKSSKEQKADAAQQDNAARQENSPTADGESSETLWQQLENAKQPGGHPQSTAEATQSSTPDTRSSTPAS